jgi:hypothetical protein
MQAENRSIYGVGMLCWVMFALFCVLIFFTFPQSDDYWFYLRFTHNHHNLFLAAAEHYQTWEHRVSSYVLATLPTCLSHWLHLPLFNIFQAYGFAILVLMTMVFSAWVKDFTTALSGNNRHLLSWSITGIVVLTYLLTIPVNLEYFYWVTNQAFWLLPSLQWIGLILWVHRRLLSQHALGGAWPAALEFGLMALYLVVLGLFNQLISLAAFIYLAGVFFGLTRKSAAVRQRESAFVLGLLVILACVMVITYTNNPRLASNAYQHANLNFISALPQALHFTLDFIAEQCRRDGLLWVLYTLFLVFLVRPLLRKAEALSAVSPARDHFFLKVLPVIITGLSMVPLGFLMHLMATSQPPPPRVLGQLHTHVFLALTYGVLFTPLDVAWLKLKQQHRAWIGVLAIWGLLVCGYYHPYSKALRHQLQSRQLKQWVQFHGQRQDYLAHLPNPRQTNVTVPSFERFRPALPFLVWFDLSPDPTYWVNTSIAAYYGVKSIRPQ